MQNNNLALLYTSENQAPIDLPYASGGHPSPIMYSDDHPHSTSQPTKKAKTSKRKQVKNACTNCQKACKKCDEGRACQRCVKLGISETCMDSPRKDRSKGGKRGPYKKRQQQNVTSGVHPDIKTPGVPYEQTVTWDNNLPLDYRPQQSQQQDYPHHQRHSSASDRIPSHDQLTPVYYSPPISQPVSSYQGTPSPLTNQYASPSLSTSPASSNVLLPQDTLQILTVDDSLGQEPIYTRNRMMMMPLQTPSSFAWPLSTSSPTTAIFAPQSTQPVYQQPYYLPVQKQQPQPYWTPVYDPHSYI